MTFTSRLLPAALMLFAAFVGNSLPAPASIKASISVPDLYRRVSLYLVVGKVAGIDPDRRMLTIQVERTLKGRSPGETVRVQMEEPADFLKKVAKGQPVVIFAGESPSGLAAMHLADTWLLAQGIAKVSPPAWRSVQKHRQLQRSFPGTTKELIRVIDQLKTETKSRRFEEKDRPSLIHAIADTSELDGAGNKTRENSPQSACLA